MALAHKQTIRTFTGLRLDLSCPSPRSIDIRDVAHGLTQTCRFAGQLPMFYSVAQHSVGAAEVVREAGGSALAELHALLHDSPEAYTADLPRPLKETMPGPVRAWWGDLEAILLQVIYEGLGIPEPTESERRMVKAADEVMLVTEDRDLRGICQFPEVPARRAHLRVWSPASTEACFLDLYHQLWGGIAA